MVGQSSNEWSPTPQLVQKFKSVLSLYGQYAYCLYKDPTDLKLWTNCGVCDHSLEDCPTMLEKINKMKNVNVLSCVQKHDVINIKNLHIVTWQGTKIVNDHQCTSKIKEKNDYPNLTKQKQLYNH